MKNANGDRELDELIEEITTDANGDAEQLWAFRQAFEDNVAVRSQRRRPTASGAEVRLRRQRTARADRRVPPGRWHKACGGGIGIGDPSPGARRAPPRSLSKVDGDSAFPSKHSPARPGAKLPLRQLPARKGPSS
jgi:hypothetical protein